MGIKEKYNETKSKCCKWMDEHPKAALGIKIGAGVAATAGVAFGCYKIFEWGVKEGADYAVDALTPHGESIVRLQFQHPLDQIAQELWPPCMKEVISPDNINEMFYQDGKEIVGLFSAVKDTDIPKILEGFVEAGANPDSIAVMFEAAVRA